MYYFGCSIRQHTSTHCLHCSVKKTHGTAIYSYNQVFFFPSVLGGNPIWNPQLPEGLTLPVTGEFMGCAGCLAPALCWLSHSPNCPWALWNSQPIWPRTCTHISKHCIDWSPGSQWTTLGDLFAVWKWSSQKKKKRQYKGEENDGNVD